MSEQISYRFVYSTIIGVCVLYANVAEGVVIRRVSDIAPGRYSSYPDDYFEFRGDVYFRATGVLGRELYRIRESQVELVADIGSGPETDSFPGGFVEFQDQLYFRVNRAGRYDQFELWRYDGSQVHQAAAMETGAVPNYVDDLVVFRDKLYFRASDPLHGVEFWQFDGSNASMVAELDPGQIIGGMGSSWPGNFHVYRDALYFHAHSPVDGAEPRHFNGKSVSRVADVNRGVGSGTGYTEEFEFVDFRGDLFFLADDGVTGLEMRRFNGSRVRTAFEIVTGPDSSWVQSPTVVGDKLYFAADDGVHGMELWVFDGTQARLAADINPGPGSSHPSYLEAFNGRLYFAAVDKTTQGVQGPIPAGAGIELWSFDGTAARLVADIATGVAGSYPSALYATDNALYFTAVTEYGSEAWRLVELDGDYSGDGRVDAADFDVWKVAFGTTNLMADGNGDGIVDAADYSVWRDSLGRSVSGVGGGSLAVPEPTWSMLICTVAASACLRWRGSTRWAATLACFIILLTSQICDAAIRTVAYSGQVAAGTGGATFESFENLDGPALNNSGDVVFGGLLASGTGDANESNETGIWVGNRQGGLDLLARQGNQVVGLPTGNFFVRFDRNSAPFETAPDISNSGHVAFQSAIWDGTSTASKRTGIWRVNRQGELQTVALSGQHPPGTPAGAKFRIFPSHAMNSAGEMVFTSTMESGAGGVTFQNSEGIWRSKANAELTLVARDQDQIPEFPAGETFDLFQPKPSINSVGQIAFNGSDAMAQTPDYKFERLSSPAIHRGDQLTPEFVYAPKINSRGQVAFFATHVVNGETQARRESGIWLRDSEGKTSIVSRYGDPIPGQPDAKMGFFMENRIEFNDLGDILFSTWVETSNGEHRPSDWWISRNGAPAAPIFHLGDPAPGLPSGFRFAGYSPRLNDRGQIMVGASAIDEATDERTNGIWIFDGGMLKLVVAKGMSIDVRIDGTTSTKVIESLQTIGNNIGRQNRPSAFNDFGEFTFAAKFVDGSSGVFVADDFALLRGDYNDNGSVGPEDYTAWQAAFGTTNLAADGNGDGVVDAADYSVWRDNLGRSVVGGGAGSLAVPEPSTATIACALIGAIGILVRGRREVM